MTLVKVVRDSPSLFTMFVKTVDGNIEKWKYERIQNSVGVDYVQIGKESD